MSLLKKKKQNEELQAKRGERYGAETMGVHSPSYSSGSDKGQSFAGDLVRGTKIGSRGAANMQGAKKEHESAMGDLKSMAGPTSGKSGFAKGGEACPDCCDGMPCEMHSDDDMVGKMMAKRKMAKGGEVESLADFKPNEFDELEVNPPPMDDSSAGNEQGDNTLFEDAVSKAMMKRRKQHNPSPA